MPLARVRGSRTATWLIALAGCGLATGCNIYGEIPGSTGGGGGTTPTTSAATGGSGGATGTTSSSTTTTSTTSSSTTSSTTSNTTSSSTTSSSTTTACAAPADCPGASTTCHEITCISNTCGASDAASGTPCTDAAGKVCDGAGACVPCNVDTDCSGTDLCSNHACVTSPCHNGAKDPGETDVDCGGVCVAGGAGTCALGAACLAPSDCSTPACTDGVCCADGCAGVCMACNLAGTKGTCAPVPDGADPASECAGGDVCNGQGACRCADGITNGAETAPDCGGGVCPACADALPCLAAADCQSGVCASNVCLPPTCSDGAKNGAESGIDCGGTCPTGCPVGGSCNVGADCNSGVCVGKICMPAVCGDGVRGGAEECDDANTVSFDGCTSTCQNEAGHLLISEIKYAPTASEFIEIYNPTSVAVDLSHYYLADYNSYYLLTLGLGAPSSTDFRLQFPPGAQIAAHAFVVVSLHTATGFAAAYNGLFPDFDLAPADANAPDMLGTYSAGSVGLTDTSEMVILFHWNGTSTHVQDVDYVIWGNDTTVRVDKSGQSVGGVVYANDTAPAAQVPAPSSVTYSLHRCDTAEAAEATGGAGNGLTGHDETSENGGAAWKITSAAKPPSPKAPPPAGLCP